MFKYIISRRYVDILKEISKLKKQNILTVSKTLKFSYTHLSTILRAFHEEGLVDKDLKGRDRWVSLTDKGEKALKLLIDIENLMNKKSDAEEFVNDPANKEIITNTVMEMSGKIKRNKK